MILRHQYILRLPCLLAASLLALNVWGMIIPNDQRDLFPEPLLSYTSALEQLEQARQLDQPQEIVRAMTETVHQAMYPGWSRKIAQVPPRQNWILWLAGFLDHALVRSGLTGVNDLFTVYQMTDHRRALERGFGVCSQQVLVLAGFLDENPGYKTAVAALSGHMVLQVTLPDDSLMLADPHKGVVLPFGLAQAQRNLSQVAALYPEGSKIPALYDAAGNQLVPGPASAYNPKLYLFEKTSYWLIWIIPGALLLLCPALLRNH